MAPHSNSRSLSAAALSGLLDRRRAAVAASSSNAVPPKLVRRRDRNLRRRGKASKQRNEDGGADAMNGADEDHDDDVRGLEMHDGSQTKHRAGKPKRTAGGSSTAVVVLSGGGSGSSSKLETGAKKNLQRPKLEERVMVLKRQRRVSKEEREVRRRIMDLRSGKTRHIAKKKQQGFGNDSDDEDDF